MFKRIPAATRTSNVFTYICNSCVSYFIILICLFSEFFVFFKICTLKIDAAESSVDIFAPENPGYLKYPFYLFESDSCTLHTIHHIKKNIDYAYVNEHNTIALTQIREDMAGLNSRVSVVHYKNFDFGEYISLHNEYWGLRTCMFNNIEQMHIGLAYKRKFTPWWMEHEIIHRNFTKKQKTIGEVENAVAYCQYYPMFGHNIHDFFAALMFLPEDVIKQGFVVMPPPEYGKRMQELFDILGFKAKILLDLKRGEQLFARNFYYIHPCSHAHCYTMGGLPRIKALIEKTFNITKIDSKRFVVMNRDKKFDRGWNNSEKLHEALIKNVAVDEGYSWELTETKIESWIDTVKYWRTIKILVSPSGSHIYNALFMAPHTGMCLEFSFARDEANMQLAICSKIFLVGVHKSNYTRYREVDIDKMCNYTQQVIDCVKKGNWKHKPGLTLDRFYYTVINNHKIFEKNFQFCKEFPLKTKTQLKTTIYDY